MTEPGDTSQGQGDAHGPTTTPPSQQEPTPVNTPAGANQIPALHALGLLGAPSNRFDSQQLSASTVDIVSQDQRGRDRRQSSFVREDGQIDLLAPETFRPRARNLLGAFDHDSDSFIQPARSRFTLRADNDETVIQEGPKRVGFADNLPNVSLGSRRRTTAGYPSLDKAKDYADRDASFVDARDVDDEWDADRTGGASQRIRMNDDASTEDQDNGSPTGPSRPARNPINPDGIEMDPAKVQAIQDWKAPKCVKDVQAFLGFANFYRRFILGFSDIARPLTALTKIGQGKFPLDEGGSEIKAFEELKQAFTKGGVLAHFNPDLPCIVESDASNWVYAAVLSQTQKDGVLRPVAFMSKKMTPAECNYEIYDKELLAIVRAFEEWRPELAGAPSSIEVLTDHRGLQWFATKRDLNQRQIRWAEFLSEFDFHIKYRPGKQGQKPDSLTRRPGDLPEHAEDDRILHRRRALLQPEQLVTESYQRNAPSDGSHEAVRLATLCMECEQLAVNDLARGLYEMAEGSTYAIPVAAGRVTQDPDPYDSVAGADDMSLEAVINILYENDDRLKTIITAKENGDRRIPWQLIQNGVRLELGDVTVRDDKLFLTDNRLFVPFSDRLRTRIVKHVHDDVTGGHGGRAATYQRVAQWYYWQGLTNTVSRLVNNCLVCRRTKSSHAAKHGLLHPLPVPERYWEDISIDFISPLPPSRWCGRTYCHVLVVVDRLSKQKKFIPMETMEVQSVVDAFIEYVWREEGYPRTITSDRGRQFTSHFWKRLCERMGTKLKLSTSHHPETDGQTEIANAGLKQFLRAYVNYLQDDWARLLPVAEFEANSEVSSATGVSPFRLTKTFTPRTGLEPPHAVPPATTTTTYREQAQRADAFAQRADDVRKRIREELAWTREKMREYANNNRSPAPQFKVGDWVMLDARNVRTERPVKSLDYKNLGPYQVVRTINDMAYELDLPPHLKALFPAFHPWLLHAYENDPLPGQVRDDAPPQAIRLDEGGEHWEIVEVLESRLRPRTIDPHNGKKGLLVYKVEWKGNDQSQSWQPYFNLRGCKDTMKDFHTRHPDQPGPHATFDDYGDDGQAVAQAFGLMIQQQDGR